MLQTKHSILSTSALGDLSPDLWKTLRIWMVGRSSGEVPVTASKYMEDAGADTVKPCQLTGSSGESRWRSTGWKGFSAPLQKGAEGFWVTPQRWANMNLDEISWMDGAKARQFVGIGACTRRPTSGRRPCYV